MAIDSEIAEEFAALGVRIVTDLIDEDADVCEIWDINRQPVSLFFELSTQWRYVGTMGRPIRLGLDYPAVSALLGMRRRRDRGRLFGDLRVMELAALTVFSEARED